MKSIVKLIPCLLLLLLTGCANLGQQSTFNERLSDNFLFTSGQSVSDNQVQCLTLTRPFQFKSGSISYSLPAGKYKGTRKNSDGYFYYAPGTITTSSWLTDSFYGIYINNQFSHGNLFTTNTLGYDLRPIRGTVLPNTIFSYIKRSC